MSISLESQERNGQQVVTAEEAAARSAVMEIAPYPDLSVALKKALGYGPHVDMLMQFVYWFHPRHPKMQKRWTLWKTFAEWYEECGLTDRQVKKGRKKLQELELLTWKRGQYGRIHYRLDWPALANVLNPDAVAVPIGDDLSDDFDDLEDFNSDAVGVPIQSGRFTVQVNPDALPSDPIQENTSGDYLQENSSLQEGADALSRTAPPQINNSQEPQEHNSLLGDNKRHSLDSDTQLESTAATEELSPAEKKDRRFIRAALEDPPTNDLAEALRRYRTGQIDLCALADTMRHENYLRGANAYSSLRPEQVGAVLEEMRETVAA